MSIPSQVQLQIATTSQVMYFNNLPKPNPPKITMNGVPIPSPSTPPFNPTGWQVVIIDPTKDITNPASIITNQYISLYPANNSNSWWNTYQYMYSSILWNQLSSANIQQQLSEQAFAYATSEPFAWRNIAASWRLLFLECLHDAARAPLREPSNEVYYDERGFAGLSSHQH